MKNKKEIKSKKNQKNSDKILSVIGAAKILGVSRESIYQYIARYDNFPWYNDENGKKRFVESKLKAWIQPISGERVGLNADNELINIETVSKKFHIGTRKVYSLTETEDFPKPVIIKHFRYFNRKELIEWLKNHPNIVKCKPEDLVGKVKKNKINNKVNNKVKRDENLLTFSEAAKHLGIKRFRISYMINKVEGFAEANCSTYNDKVYIDKNKLDKWIADNNITLNKPKRSDGYIPITDLLNVYKLTPNKLSMLTCASTFPNITKYGLTNYVKEEEVKQWMKDHDVAAKKPRRKARKRVNRKK